MNMKRRALLPGIMVGFLLFGAFVCQAEKWDKNDFQSKTVEAAFYNADSVKVQKEVVSWTEKVLFTKAGSVSISEGISKYEACKNTISERGPATHSQTDYMIKKGNIRLVAKRYYNKANKILCTDRDMGKDFNTSWSNIERFSPAEKAKYDLVTKYKVKFPK